MSEAKFAKMENLVDSDKTNLRHYINMIRRKTKYIDFETITEHDLVNKCFAALGKNYLIAGCKTTQVEEILGLRARYTPLIVRLLTNAMVEERSAMLKGFKKELKGTTLCLFVQFPFFLFIFYLLILPEGLFFILNHFLQVSFRKTPKRQERSWNFWNLVISPMLYWENY